MLILTTLTFKINTLFNKKPILLLICCCLLLVEIPKVNSQIDQFQRVYPNLSGFDSGVAIKPTIDGGYYCLVSNDTISGSQVIREDANILKINSKGDILWKKSLNKIGKVDTSHSIQGYRAAGIITNQDGGCIVISQINGDIGLINLDKNGILIWEKLLHNYDNLENYKASSQISHEPISMAIGNDFIFSGGYYNANTKTFGAYLIKTDQLGNIIYENKYLEEKWMNVVNIMETPDKGFLIVGSIYDNNNYTMFILKTDVNGKMLWTKKINALQVDYYPIGITIDPNNEYVNKPTSIKISNR